MAASVEQMEVEDISETDGTFLLLIIIYYLLN